MPRTLLLICYFYCCFPLFLFSHGDLHELIQRTSKKIEQSPNNADLYLYRGQLYNQHNALDKAKSDLKKAQQLNPTLFITDLLLAEVFAKDKLPVRALDYANTFLKNKPNNPDGLIVRAGIYRQLKKELAAEQDFKAAFIALKKPTPTHYIAITAAILRADSTNVAEAVSWLDKGQAQFGFDIVLKQKEAELLTKNGQYKEALLAIDTILSRFPRKEKWLFQKGQICEKSNQPIIAKTHYAATLKAIQDLPKRLQMTRNMLDLEARTIERIQSLEKTK